jgi:hypothetical protein
MSDTLGQARELELLSFLIAIGIEERAERC